MSYKEYLTERFNNKSYYLFTKDTYRLAAIGGDASANGMGNVATILEVDKDDFERVNRYLEIESEIQEIMTSCGYKTVPKEEQEILQWLEELRAEVKDKVCEYFTNKYHFRSSWAWLETPEFDSDSYEQDEEAA